MSGHSEKLGIVENAITIRAQEVARSEMDSLFSSLEFELRTKAGVNVGAEMIEIENYPVSSVLAALRRHAEKTMANKVALELAEEMLAKSELIDEEYTPLKQANNDDF
jgi:hypothetical protein